MIVKRGNWTMTEFSRRDEVTTDENGDHWARTTQVRFATDEFIHDGKVCDGVVVSFASASGVVDIEVMACSEGSLASLEPVLPHLEQDDLFLAACQGILDHVERTVRAAA